MTALNWMKPYSNGLLRTERGSLNHIGKIPRELKFASIHLNRTSKRMLHHLTFLLRNIFTEWLPRYSDVIVRANVHAPMYKMYVWLFDLDNVLESDIGIDSGPALKEGMNITSFRIARKIKTCRIYSFIPIYLRTYLINFARKCLELCLPFLLRLKWSVIFISFKEIQLSTRNIPASTRRLPLASATYVQYWLRHAVGILTLLPCSSYTKNNSKKQMLPGLIRFQILLLLSLIYTTIVSG